MHVLHTDGNSVSMITHTLSLLIEDFLSLVLTIAPVNANGNRCQDFLHLFSFLPHRKEPKLAR